MELNTSCKRNFFFLYYEIELVVDRQNALWSLEPISYLRLSHARGLDATILRLKLERFSFISTEDDTSAVVSL